MRAPSRSNDSGTSLIILIHFRNLKGVMLSQDASFNDLVQEIRGLVDKIDNLESRLEDIEERLTELDEKLNSLN